MAATVGEEPHRGAHALRCAMLFAGDATEDWLGYVRESDKLGFHALGIGDSPSIYQDVYMRGVMAVQCTSRMRVGPLVTNPLLRHPVVTACAAATLEQIAPGRAFVAIGTGDSAAANAGLRHGTLEQLERYAMAVKELLSSGAATWQGASVRFAMKSPKLPVYVAAAGPKTLEMAAQVADGVVVGTGVSAQAVELALESIEKGARRSGRSAGELDVWFLVHASLAENDAHAHSAIVNSLVTKVHVNFKTDAALRVLPARLHGAARDVVRRYDALHHADFEFEGHKQLAREYPELMSYVGDRYTVVGDPAAFTQRLQEIHAAGVKNLWIHPRTAYKKEFLRLWRKHLSPCSWIV